MTSLRDRRLDGAVGRRTAGLCALLLMLPGWGGAQSVSWSGEAGVSAWTSNRLLDARQGVAVGRLKLGLVLSPSDDWQVRAEGWAITDAGRQGRSADLKEAFVAWRGGPCQPSLGKRMVSWGKTDVITPTDQLSPTDLTRLVGKDTDQRDGVWGLHGRCVLGDGVLDAHWLTHFETTQVPIESQSGVSIDRRRQSVPATRALRYEHSSDGLDWAVSALDGHDLLPTISLREVNAQGMVLQLRPSRMRMVGLDVAAALSDWVLRGEVAGVSYPAQPAPSLDQTSAIRLPYTQWVLGAERGLGDRESLTVQVFARHQRGDAAGLTPLAQQLQAAQGLISQSSDRKAWGLTLRYARPFAESRGEGDVLLVWSQPRSDWMLRSRVGYSLTDEVRLSLGLDVLRGRSDSVLGHLRPNSLGFAELSVAW